MCIFNITYLGNVSKLTSHTVESYFWSIANAQTKEKYESKMLILDSYNSKVSQYVYAINPTLWVTAFYPGQYFVHETSNIFSQ